MSENKLMRDIFACAHKLTETNLNHFAVMSFSLNSLYHVSNLIVITIIIIAVF